MITEARFPPRRCGCRHGYDAHEEDGFGKCTASDCRCKRSSKDAAVKEAARPKFQPRELTDDFGRNMARGTRDLQWRFMESCLWHVVLWFCHWNKSRRIETENEWRTALITGLEIWSWCIAHPEWFWIGDWDYEREAYPIALTEAGYEALCHRDLYDLEPVTGGLVEPGWTAIPWPRS